MQSTKSFERESSKTTVGYSRARGARSCDVRRSQKRKDTQESQEVAPRRVLKDTYCHSFVTCECKHADCPFAHLTMKDVEALVKYNEKRRLSRLVRGEEFCAPATSLQQLHLNPVKETTRRVCAQTEDKLSEQIDWFTVCY